MTVPKKRKKLDNSIDPVIVREEQDNVNLEANQVEEKVAKPKKAANTHKSPKAKVEKAFEVIDKIDKNIQEKAIELKKVNALTVQGNEGIHIRFKVDLIRWQDFVDGGKGRTEDDSVVIDFTLPYIWNLPVIGDATKALIKELVKLKIL
ncbi:MAG TPA: hypothetical protein PK079_06125 [Leptospiraceae bacterium]|nr:hypothetical protein [Leptospiraceae bacterium]HMW07889.1 hypothetical protein [Leptospiraceae bacterium]HMX33772.1 hypothetical protein [Leptospiraceae bacterium]HMY31152.1 hypothetical protein [Leptospiraceae bacterium]HMZ66665.1 hypothetical protein [Leptospiraceae bacterium]